jgi:1-hydroxycarotenoid 3,4-desaturase
MAGVRAVIIGAGIGGLTAAIDLAGQGLDVTLAERAPGPGGKLRGVTVGGLTLDAGPTVFTMRSVFDALFADAGTSLEQHLTLRPLNILARHAWSENERLDLFADPRQSADAIGDFAGAAEARRFLEFSARARQIFETLDSVFMRAQRPDPVSLAIAAAPQGLGRLWGISPFTTMWQALGRYFHDPRLRQLFGRYATYCGSSPFASPATLMLVAHAEQMGVWTIDGGMHRLAEAMAQVATARGVTIRYDTAVAEVLVAQGRARGIRLATGEHLVADVVVCNTDTAALPSGLLGRKAEHAASKTPAKARSLSAVTWLMRATASGFALHRHNVFFSGNCAQEFDDIFTRARLPSDPTVYVCAQDRGDDAMSPAADERFLCLINAPPTGDRHGFDVPEIEQCSATMFHRLESCGLQLESKATAITTPADFHRLYPATGGALYGRASHGWMASFQRPAARSKLPGLYLAGGSTHPGPGVPMAAISGRLAAQCVIADLASTKPPRAAAATAIRMIIARSMSHCMGLAENIGR